MTRARFAFAVLTVTGAASAAAVALALGASGHASARSPEPATAGPPLPRFSLVDQHGSAVRASALHEPTVVLFLDAHCTDTCPLVVRTVANALRALPPATRRSVAILAVDVGYRDTAAAARRFLAHEGAAGSGIRWLVGPRAGLAAAWHAFGVAPATPSGGDDVHSDPVLVYDSSGRLRHLLAPGVDLTAARLTAVLRAGGR